MRFSCGVIFGILLTLALIAGTAGFFYYRAKQQEVRQKWDQTKNAGDNAWQKTKDTGDQILQPDQKKSSNSTDTSQTDNQ